MKFDKIYKIRLKKKEKEEIRQHLLNFIEKNPVRNSKDERLSEHPAFEHFYSLTQKFMHALLLKPAATVIALVVATGGGVGYAAQGSVPGDLLYSYKIHVNENLRAGLAFSAESQAELALDLANERLEEAAQLAVEGELTTEVRTDLQERFEEHMLEGYDDLAELRGDEEFVTVADLTAELETGLLAHEEFFRELAENSEGKVKIEITLLVDKIKIEIKTATKEKTEVAAEGKLKAAENKLESVIKFVEKKKAKVDEATQAEVDAQLDLAASLLEEGRLELENGNFGAAFTLFQEAHQAAQEAKLLLEIGDEEDDESEEPDEGDDEDDDDDDDSDSEDELDEEEADEPENDEDEPEDDESEEPEEEDDEDEDDDEDDDDDDDSEDELDEEEPDEPDDEDDDNDEDEDENDDEDPETTIEVDSSGSVEVDLE